MSIKHECQMLHKKIKRSVVEAVERSERQSKLYFHWIVKFLGLMSNSQEYISMSN